MRKFLIKELSLSFIGNLFVLLVSIYSAKTCDMILNIKVSHFPVLRIVNTFLLCVAIFLCFYWRKISLIKFCLLLEKRYEKQFTALGLIKLFEASFINLIDVIFTFLFIFYLLFMNKYVLLMPILSIFISLFGIIILHQARFKRKNHQILWKAKFLFFLATIYYFFDAMNIFYLRSLFVNGYLSFMFGIVAVMLTTKILHAWNNFFQVIDNIEPENGKLVLIKNITLIKKLITNYDKI